MTEMIQVNWWEPALVFLLAMMFGYYARAVLERRHIKAAADNADRLIETAKKEAVVLRKEAEVDVKDEVHRVRGDFEVENKTRRQELSALEARVIQRETNLDRRVDLLDKKEQSLDERIRSIETERTELVEKKTELDQVIHLERDKLQTVAAMSQEEARDILKKQLDDELRAEAGAYIRRIQEEAQERAEKDAREIVTMAIERYAASQVNEITTSSVSLPNDEMKGRIIGREGRNIRSLEAATGVNILIDDTPEVVVISGFDPLRREMARVTLDRLISDGRIHPGRIEEVVSEVEAEIEETVRSAGEEAIFELGLQGVAPELVRTLGKLKFRHSYGQNVLQHSIEMAHLLGMMASELGLEPSIAKRVGLFHDIGKAIDHEVEGGHAIIGADLMKKHGEESIVCNAVASHHGDVPTESLYAHLVTAADAMTAARPGARSETTEVYLKRLEKLEGIANAFRGVEKCYAIQAGREIRVLVEPSQINDDEAMQMARNISKQIETEMTYPGQIKVTVLRETRCIEFAK